MKYEPSFHIFDIVTTRVCTQQCCITIYDMVSEVNNRATKAAQQFVPGRKNWCLWIQKIEAIYCGELQLRKKKLFEAIKVYHEL